MVDISDTLAPKSQQLDNIDLTHGPRTFTITKVERRDSEDQPLWIHLAEFDRPWPPNVNMRRVIAHVWGKESDVWIGRRFTLFRDARIKFGPDTTGGTRISHMSHITKKAEIPVLASKGRPATYTVEPLVEEAPAPASASTQPRNEPTAAQVADCTDQEVLGRMWQSSGADRRVEIEARVAELKALAEYDRQKEQDHVQAEGARAEDGA